MSNFNRLNFKTTVNKNIDTRNNEFIKLTDYAKKYKKALIKGFFFTNGRYGKNVVAVTDKYNINMPSFAVSIFEEIEEDNNLLNELVTDGTTIGNFRELPPKMGKNPSILFDFID